jgi:hypothetical protein
VEPIGLHPPIYQFLHITLEAVYGILLFITYIKDETNIKKDIPIAETNIDVLRKQLKSLVTCVQIFILLLRVLL